MKIDLIAVENIFVWFFGKHFTSSDDTFFFMTSCSVNLGRLKTKQLTFNNVPRFSQPKLLKCFHQYIQWQLDLDDKHIQLNLRCKFTYPIVNNMYLCWITEFVYVELQNKRKITPQTRLYGENDLLPYKRSMITNTFTTIRPASPTPFGY